MFAQLILSVLLADLETAAVLVAVTEVTVLDVSLLLAELEVSLMRIELDDCKEATTLAALTLVDTTNETKTLSDILASVLLAA